MPRPNIDQTAGPTALSAVGLRRTFGSTVALTDADLDIPIGSVHSLVGENGAGKSTFAGLIGGRLEPTSGSATLFGEPAPLGKLHRIRQMGVCSIYQELTIVPELTTQANLFLGEPLARGGLLREKEMQRQFVAICEEFGVAIPVDVPAGALSVADQQLLEVMRAMQHRKRFIIFDEPTAALTLPERQAFIRLVKQLQQQGITQMLVSHDLSEVFDLADHVTVFRNGQIVQSKPLAEWSKSELTREIHGDRIIASTPQRGDPGTLPDSTGSLIVSGLERPGSVSGISLEVQRGEIVGLTGLIGAGRSTIINSIGGAVRASGSLTIDGRQVAWPRSPRAARDLGIGLLADDRKKKGLLPELSSMENVIVSDYAPASFGGVINKGRLLASAEKATARFTVPRSRLRAAAGTLSGGNQQKLLFARWIHRGVSYLLADEPTRGIDIGAKAEIKLALHDLARSGVGVLLTSTETQDLIDVCDRILLVREGQIIGEVRAGDPLFDTDRLDELLATPQQPIAAGSSPPLSVPSTEESTR